MILRAILLQKQSSIIYTQSTTVTLSERCNIAYCTYLTLDYLNYRTYFHCCFDTEYCREGFIANAKNLKFFIKKLTINF